MSSSTTAALSSPATAAVKSSSAKQVIFDLPISPDCPIYHLKPDPLFPTVKSLFDLSGYVAESAATMPSMSRRSRQIREGANFSYVSPLPLTFPYEITEPGETANGGQESTVQAVTIETRLAEYEPSSDYHVAIVHSNSAAATASEGVQSAFSSILRESKLGTATLLAFSQRCADEWLPNLDVGDASTCVISGSGSQDEVAKRMQFVDVAAGKTVLARLPLAGGESAAEKLGFAPFSLSYAGHQFGQFAGQLGDGRAISILSTPTTAEVQKATGISSVELQLKGAGRTPFSRFADGLAVTRSSIREFLGAEAMAALRIPTSRALALVGIPGVRVRRERMEGAAIVTRVAASWIRIGCFELPVYRQEWESLRGLSHFVARNVLKIDDSTCPPTDSKTSRSLSLEVISRSSNANAIMIAGWQSVGFMHGVMNTDNISIRGETIDYGPYAFMDIFDRRHICNHSDEEGRYSWEKQPSMGVFAVEKLGESLASLIGCEEELSHTASLSQHGYVAASQGWRDSVDEAKIKEWTSFGMDRLAEVKAEFMVTFSAEYIRLMRSKLGLLAAPEGSADSVLISTLLDLLSTYSLDYSSSIRLLSQFPSSSSPLLSRYFDLLLPADLVPANLQSHAREAWSRWFIAYEARLQSDEEMLAASKHADDRRTRMNRVNPRFILRQWILEETIERVGQTPPDLISLDRALQMAGQPFEAYGEEMLEGGDVLCAIDPVERSEDQERLRLCSIGSEKLLGFQCSCSS